LRNREAHSSSYSLLMVSTVFLGPVGMVGVALTSLIRFHFTDKAQDLESRFLALFPDEASSPPALLCERILNGESGAQIRDTLASFADVMANGAIHERQAVVALISSQFQPAFAPFLYQALSDLEPAVRVQAATAVARLESAFLEKAILLKDRCDHEPARSDLVLSLARHYDEYGNSGLLDPARALATRMESLALYRRCLVHGKNEEQINASIIRLLVHLERQGEAVSNFGPLVDSGQASVHLLTWYAEALYKLGRFSDLRKLCIKFDAPAFSPALLSEPCHQALALWAGDSSPR
jgi:polysaccharide biosynthesis protein PelE